MTLGKDEIRSYYEDKLSRFGSSAKGMDWKNQESQYLRFDIISRYIDYTLNPTILDVGCGNGEFLQYTKLKELSCKYTGIDLVLQMVKLANSRFEKEIAFFSDLDNVPLIKPYDYVIASGTYNAKLNVGDTLWEDYFFRSIRKMFQLSKKAIVFNCMSHRVDYRYDRLYYLSEDDISNFVFNNLSRNYIIDHSYPLFEMTITVYK